MYCRVFTWIPCIHKHIWQWWDLAMVGDNSVDINANYPKIWQWWVDQSVIVTSDIQMEPHACRVMSKALHAYELCETCHIWLCDLVHYVIGEQCDFVWSRVLGDASALEIMLWLWEWCDDISMMIWLENITCLGKWNILLYALIDLKMIFIWCYYSKNIEHVYIWYLNPKMLFLYLYLFMWILSNP